MLVLTRKTNERIVIGENIRITVVGVRGSHVRLGIEAPPEVTILRDELTRLSTPERAETCREVGEALHTVPASCTEGNPVPEPACASR